MLARGKPGDDGQSVIASFVIVMKQGGFGIEALQNPTVSRKFGVTENR